MGESKDEQVAIYMQCWDIGRGFGTGLGPENGLTIWVSVLWNISNAWQANDEAA